MGLVRADSGRRASMDRLLNVAILDALEYDMMETLRRFSPPSGEEVRPEDDVASIDSEMEHLASLQELIHEEMQELDSTWRRETTRGNEATRRPTEASFDDESCGSIAGHRGQTDCSVTDTTEDTAVDDSTGGSDDVHSCDDASVVLDSLQWDDFIRQEKAESTGVLADDIQRIVDRPSSGSCSEDFLSPSELPRNMLALPEFPWLVPRVPTTVRSRSLTLAGDFLASQLYATHPTILLIWLKEQLKSPKLLPKDYYRYLPVVGSFRSSGRFLTLGDEQAGDVPLVNVSCPG